MFNFPGEKYTGKPIINNNGFQGAGYYSCHNKFPGQAVYTWERQGPASMTQGERQYWGRILGTLSLIRTQKEFDRITG